MGSTARQAVFSQASARHCKKESPPAARPSGFESWGGAISLPRGMRSQRGSTRMLGLVRADRRRIDPNRTRAFFRRAKRAGFFQAFRYAFGGRTRQCGSNFMRPQLDLAPGTSKLGSWSYEVYDCKFACETKAARILQLSLSSELLERLSVRGRFKLGYHCHCPRSQREKTRRRGACGHRCDPSRRRRKLHYR
jgi:hypothetical protein